MQLRVAEMVLKYGGKLNVQSMGKADGYEVARPEEIPPEPFVINRVDLAGRKEVTDNALSVLSELPYLGESRPQRYAD